MPMIIFDSIHVHHWLPNFNLWSPSLDSRRVCGVSRGGWQNIHEKTRENIQKPRGQSRVGEAHEGLPPRFLDILSSFWGNIEPSPELNSTYCHSLLFFGRHQCYTRLHLVDCVVARSATKLGGLGACPHSREATYLDVQYPPLGVKSQYLLILAPPLGVDIEYLKYD